LFKFSTFTVRFAKVFLNNLYNAQEL